MSMKSLFMQVYALSSGFSRTTLLVLAQVALLGWAAQLGIHWIRSTEGQWAGKWLVTIAIAVKRWTQQQLDMPPPPPAVDRVFRYGMAGFSFVLALVVFVHYVVVVMAWIPLVDRVSVRLTVEVLAYVLLAPIVARWMVAQGIRELRG
jgi:hypothetical protein